MTLTCILVKIGVRGFLASSRLSQVLIKPLQVDQDSICAGSFGLGCLRKTGTGEKGVMYAPACALVGQGLEHARGFPFDQFDDHVPPDGIPRPPGFAQQE